MSKLYGWTGKIACINLTDRKISMLPTENYSEKFIGGLGIGQQIYLEESNPINDAFHPDNPLIFMTGPLTGTIAPSAPRLSICGKSPCAYPETFSSANIGGFIPAELKKAGYDGIVIKGRAENPVYLIISNDNIQIKDAQHLWGMKNSETHETIRNENSKSLKIISIGPAAENRTRLGIIFTDSAGSASMGFGSVMGSKNLKAIAAIGSNKIPVADRDTIMEIRKQHRQMREGNYFNLFGTPYPLPGIEVVKKAPCHGCPQGCWRTLRRSPSGAENIHKCQTDIFYAFWDRKRNGELTDANFNAINIVNDYSICLIELTMLLLWLERCFEQGILTEKEMELPFSERGSLEFLETYIQKICSLQGFGEILAQGTLRASETIGGKAREITRNFLTQTGRGIAYGPKVFLPSAVIYATEPRPSISELHEICEPMTKWGMWHTSGGKDTYVSTEVLRGIGEKFWGGRESVDFSTYDGKARAAALIQNRQYVKESLTLCDFAWPVYDSTASEDHIGDPGMESRLLTAVTGKDTSAEELNTIGERIFNLNRAILIREGRKGREDDYLPEFFFIEREEFIADVFGRHNPDLLLPGRGDEIISRKGKAVDKNEFKKMMDEYYKIRGWDVETGLIKKETTDRLGLSSKDIPVLE